VALNDDRSHRFSLLPELQDPRVAYYQQNRLRNSSKRYTVYFLSFISLKASMVGFTLVSRSYYYLRRRSPGRPPPFPPDHRQAGRSLGTGWAIKTLSNRFSLLIRVVAAPGSRKFNGRNPFYRYPPAGLLKSSLLHALIKSEKRLIKVFIAHPVPKLRPA